MSLKNFLMKKMLKSKMKDMPDEQADKMIELIEKNPDLFQKIGKEVQDKMNGGMDQMKASMEVMKKYESELKNIF
jgi:hypothetical protein